MFVRSYLFNLFLVHRNKSKSRRLSWKKKKKKKIYKKKMKIHTNPPNQSVAWLGRSNVRKLSWFYYAAQSPWRRRSTAKAARQQCQDEQSGPIVFGFLLDLFLYTWRLCHDTHGNIHIHRQPQRHPEYPVPLTAPAPKQLPLMLFLFFHV